MIILQQSNNPQTFSFIPKSNTYNGMFITDDQTNDEVQVSITSSTTGDYVNTITATFNLIENRFYNLVLKNNADIIYKDRIFCTNQSIVTYSVNNGQYTTNATTNEFIVYE